MGKEIYVGVDGVARKVAKIYTGAEGTAREATAGYMGAGGVARQVWPRAGATIRIYRPPRQSPLIDP